MSENNGIERLPIATNSRCCIFFKAGPLKVFATYLSDLILQVLTRIYSSVCFWKAFPHNPDTHTELQNFF